MQRMTLSLAAILIALTSLSAWTQEKPKSSKPAAVEEEKTTGRLPNNYGKLGLSDTQKKKIYTTQSKYATEINALTKQLEELKEKRDAEVEAVLTAEQKVKLAELQGETAKKSAAKKASKTTAEAEAPAKSETPAKK